MTGIRCPIMHTESPCMCGDLLKYVSTFEFLSNYFFLSQTSEHFLNAHIEDIEDAPLKNRSPPAWCPCSTECQDHTNSTKNIRRGRRSSAVLICCLTHLDGKVSVSSLCLKVGKLQVQCFSASRIVQQLQSWILCNSRRDRDPKRVH